VTPGPSTGTGPFRAVYASALHDHLHDPTETSLRAAYELARDAVSRQLSVLDLAVAHQEALLAALAGASGAAEAQHIAEAAGDFFLEGLSTYEMVQRGFKEAHQAVRHERRQTELSRQLSSFLADASLALDARESIPEMLQLVAEQARDLLDAGFCRIVASADGRPFEAVSADGGPHPGDNVVSVFPDPFQGNSVPEDPSSDQFGQLEAGGIEATIRPENRPSRRVVEKLGFREEGLRRKSLHIDGAWRDHLCFALTVEDVGAGLLPQWRAALAAHRMQAH